MSDLNVFSVIGRLTKNAELKYVGAKQTPCAEFTIANNTGFGNYAKTSFVDVQLWGQSASGVTPYLLKGTQVAVSGEFVQNSWVDQNGQKHTVWRLSTTGVTLLGSAKGKDQAQAQEAYGQPSDDEFGAF